MSTNVIQAHIESCPEGALPVDIADALGVKQMHVMKTLRKLAARGIVVASGDVRYQTRAMWRLVNQAAPAATTKSAAANLALMSAACVERLRAGLPANWVQEQLSEVSA